MDQIWLAAPSPAMHLLHGAPRGGWRLNDAALSWAETRGVDASAWSALATHLHTARAGADATTAGEFPPLGLHWRAVPLADGTLFWLTPTAQVVSGEPAPWRSAQDKLALVQELGAIGVFERNLVTGEGRWDAQLFRLFDLAPQARSPEFGVALLRVHADDRERFAQAHQRFAREGGRQTLRYRIVLPDGRQRDLVSLVDVRAEAGRDPMMMGVIVDESEGAGRVRAQEAISAHLVRAIALAQVSVWRIDDATKRIQFNDVGYRMSSLTPHADGVALDELREMVHPEDRAKIRSAFEAAIAGHEAIDAEARYVAPDGGYLHLFTRRVAERNERGEVVGMMGIAFDQSDRIAERQRAQALSRRIELVAEAAELGIWNIDIETRTVEWNAQMYRIYGRSKEAGPPSMHDWLGAQVHPDDRPRLTALQRRALRADEQAFEIEFRICRPDGSVRWVVSRSRRDRQDGRRLLVGIHLDTTELMTQRLLAEQAVNERQSVLRASQAKSDFLSRASHELRTPLNAVLGFAQLMELDGPGALPPVQLERVAHIRSAGEHLLALVNDVLDLAAIEAGRLPVTMEAVAVDTVLREVTTWLGPQAQRAQIGLHLAPSGGRVMADARRLRQIVSNLLSNAIKFNQAGGAVWLSALPVTVAGERAWQIVVRDDGRGVLPAQQARLFEAFHRLGVEREGIEGVGLGLAMVRQLAEAMGGTAEVASVPGRGSEFRVTLAAAASGPLPETGGAGAPEPTALSVLYIEDNPVNVLLIEGLIALRPGITLHAAENGLAGVAQAIASPPHVVLVDLQLPDIHGLEVLRRLRAEPGLKDTLMVALSANGQPEDIARAKAAGFDDYWTKPIDFKQFLARLDEIIAGVRETGLPLLR